MDEEDITNKSEAVQVQLEDGIHYYNPVTGEELLDFFEPDFDDYIDDRDDQEEDEIRKESEKSEREKDPENNEQADNPGNEGAGEGSEEIGETTELGEAGELTEATELAEGAELAEAGGAAVGGAEAVEGGLAIAAAPEEGVAIGVIATVVAVIAIIVVIAAIIFGAMMGASKDEASATPNPGATLPATGTNGEKIAAAALAEYKIAPHESPLGSNCGVDKYTLGSCEAWCADFVSYILKQAGTPFTGGDHGGYVISGVDAVESWFKSKKKFVANNGTNLPQPGDIAIYNRGGSSHVNIVISVSGKNINTIGGNEGIGYVKKGVRLWKGNSNLVGFGRM